MDPRTQPAETSGPPYVETLALAASVHHRLLDAIKLNLDQLGRRDLTPVQALILYNIGDRVLNGTEIERRRCYLGTNVAHNLKRLREKKFLVCKRNVDDRRVIAVELSDKGRVIRDSLEALFKHHASVASGFIGLADKGLRSLNDDLRRLDRFLIELIVY